MRYYPAITRHLFPTLHLALSIFALLCLVSLGTVQAHAQGYERMSDTEAEVYGEHAHVTGDYDTMKNIRRFWQQEVQRLRHMRQIDFSLTGNSEAVLKVTIPSRLLFNQNDSTLVSSAEGQLRPFLRLVKGPDAVATLIISAHTDNNGSPHYLQRLSTGRANVLFRWFGNQSVGPANLHSFGFADRVSRNNNKDIRERERNRRICLYFVPNKRMLKLAKKGEI